MASWNPSSYVAEALSSRITAFAEKGSVEDAPSYYEAITEHFQAYEESRSINMALEEQLKCNTEVAVDLCGTPFFVLFNSCNMENISQIKRLVRDVVTDLFGLKETIMSEFLHINGKSGDITLSCDLFNILDHIKKMNFWTKSRFDPTFEKGCDLARSQEKSGLINQLLLADGLKAQWPQGLTLFIGDYLNAWLVDRVVIRLEEMNELSGGLVNYEGFSRAFGHPRGGEMWKSGIWGTNAGGEKRYVACLNLSAERPSVATSVFQGCFSDLFGIVSSTANCRTTTTAFCLAQVLLRCGGTEVALQFIQEWREAHSSESSRFLLGFLLILKSGKVISDQSDTVVGENNAFGLYLGDNKAQIDAAHKKIERKMRYEEYALRAVMRHNSSDGCHLISTESNKTLERQVESCFSRLPSVCVAASYVGYRGQVCVTVVKGFEFSRDDDRCLFCLSQSSPLYNYVFATGSRFTFNFFHFGGDEVYDAMVNAYPSWINQSENNPVFFEFQGERYVTTNILRKECTQVAFVTVKSFLVADRLVVVGRLLGDAPQAVLLKCENSFLVYNCSPCNIISPVFFTTVHKQCGTVGLVGHGCHLCCLNPPIIFFRCPSESSSFVLDERHAGPNCTVSFVSKEGSSLFSGKQYTDLRSSIPISASRIISLSSDTLAFRVKGRIVQTLSEYLGEDTVCIIAITSIAVLSGEPAVLKLSSESGFLSLI